MKKITNREKVVLGFGVVITIGILVYFFLWPVLMGNQSKSKSDLKAKQERLQSVEKLKALEPMITELEKDMRNQLGYSQMTFEHNSAEAVIMKQLAQIANQSEIKEIEQLDVKPEKGKKSLASLKGDQSILESTVDRLYASQVAIENKPTAPKEVKPQSNNPTKEKDTNLSEKNEKDAEASIASSLIFPPIPIDIPENAKQALVKFVQAHDGQTITSENVNEIIDSSGSKDEQDSDRTKKRLTMYGNRVKEKKKEVIELMNNLGMLKDAKIEGKAGRFTAKMVFKSEIGQLIRLLYNMQTSAKWVKVEGIQITMADRQRALLAVELNMTATALYD